MSEQKFNRLTIINFHHSDKRSRRHYLCRCDCGIEKVVQGSLLTSGNTKSCGCLAREQQEIQRRLRTLPHNMGVIHQIILGYKRHAKRRGFVFLLTDIEVADIIKQPCYYCGCLPSNNIITKNCKGFLYNGIDRVDSQKDYTIDNVVASCRLCNKAKMALSKESFLNWVRQVYMHSCVNLVTTQWN